MALSENRVTNLEGDRSVDIFLSQNKENQTWNGMQAEGGTPMMVMQMYGPEYDQTGDMDSIWFGEQKARELMNHLRTFLALFD